MKYDYLIIGSGLFGSVFAHLAAKAGKTCLIVEQREHHGGNVYSENIEGIDVHKYGPHIFHTNDEDIWNFVNQFSEFVPYIYSPKAIGSDSKLYSLPFNMNTFNEIWGANVPQVAKVLIDNFAVRNENPQNLEEQALSLVGKPIYEKLIKHYTKKQWMKDPKDLPAFIIKRLPVRFTYDNNYFNDKYQGIPKDGYARFMYNIISHPDVKDRIVYVGNTTYRKGCELESLAHRVVYTGKIDEYFDYQFGELEYRTLKFEHKVIDTDNYQGVAVINNCTAEDPWTRTIEHRHFDKYCKSEKTVVTTETPDTWDRNKIPYYPINDETNTRIFKQYEQLAQQEKNVIFGGRLSEYRYYDMHQVIGSAMSKWRKEYERL